MAGTLGDLTLNIVLKITEAEKGAKQITGSLKNVDGIANKLIQTSSDLSGKMSKLGFALNGVREAGQILNSSLSTVFNTIRVSNEAYQQYLSSTRQLEAASKLTGANLNELKNISAQTKDQFSLTSGQSNLFTIELTKLGQKAGDVTKVQQSIKALMDLGAGQGLDAEQTLYAIKQAILGIDEGTDKLFQKNPSVLYDEFAKSIGTTAGKLTDQQKAQALLNSVLDSGGKLNGQYSDYLNTAAGQQQILNSKIQDAKIKLGEQLQPVLLIFLGHVNDWIAAYNNLSSTGQTLVVGIGVLTTALIKAIPLIVAFKDSFSGVLSSIKSLNVEGVPAIKSFASNVAMALGKGSVVMLALLALWSLVDDLITAIKDLIYWKNKIASIEENQTKIITSVNPESDATSVPLKTDEKGSLNILSEEDAKALGIYPESTIAEQSRRIVENQTKITDSNKKVVGTNKEVKNSYKELEEAIRSYNDILTDLNASRTIEETRDRLLRQKEIDESSGRVREFYGPDSKDKTAGKAGVPEAEDSFRKMLDISNQIQGIFNFGGSTLLFKFINALQITQQIVALLESLKLASGIFDFFKGLLGIGTAVATGGASVAVGGAGGSLNAVQGGRILNSQSTNIERVPYAVTLRADGRDLKAVITAVDKVDNARLK